MPNPNPAPAPSPAPEPIRHSWVWRVWHVGHGTARLGWRVFLVLLCLLLYLWLIGLPGFLVNRWIQRIDSRPFRVGLERVTFDPTAGLVASGLYLYHEQDFSEPLARMQHVIMEPDWAALRHGELAFKALHLTQGSLRLPDLTRSNASPVRLAARDIRAHIELHPDRVELHPVRLQMFGINWHGTGAVWRIAGATNRVFIWRELDRALAAVSQAPPATAMVAEELNDLRFDPPPLAQVGFRVDPAWSNRWEVRVSAEGSHALIRGASFDHVQADASLQGYRLQLDDLTLGAQGRRGHMAGTLDLMTRELSARLFSDLPTDPWIAMLPQAWRDELRAAGISAAGSMKSELWIGPAPLDEVARSLHGWISLQRGQVRGIPLEKGYCSVRVAGDSVYFDDISAVVGQEAGRGPLEGAIVWQRASNEISGNVQFHFDPNLIMPLLTHNQSNLVRRFKFPEEPPRFAGRFRWIGGTSSFLSVTGKLQAGACSYRDVALTAVVATLSVDRNLLTLAPWTFGQTNGHIAGSLQYDLEQSLFTVDLSGDMHPHAVAGMVGPGLQRALSRTRFEGPVYLQARGQVDGRHSDKRTDLHLRAEARYAGVSNWLADSAAFDLHARAGQYVTTNVSGSAFGGNFKAEVWAGPEGTASVYRVIAALTNAELARVAAQVRPQASFDQQGKIRLHLDVTGPVDDPGLTNMTGSGEVHVERGEIMRLPLLGGLSHLLSTLYPGLGFASQDDLHASFTVAGGRVSTEDARLEGPVMGIKAKGYYTLGGGVRFRVEVQLLRKGPLASVLRLVTLPVTKLLIFQLSGTIQDPHWRPVNLPKELFLIFE